MPCSGDEEEDVRTWDVEDSLIVEVPPTIQTDESWKRWRMPAALALSVTVTVLALITGWSSNPRMIEEDVATATFEELLQKIPTNGSQLEVWQKDWVSDAVQHAKGLQLEQPLRNLKDVFYNEISETSDDYPFIRTECVIDTVQATAYLIEAIVNLYRAIDQRGRKCGDGGTPDQCAVNVIGFITCMTWVAAYLSLASSACAQAVNSGALCSADWTTIAGAFGEIAYAGAGVRTDCKIWGKWAKRKGWGVTTTKRPYLKYFPDARLLKEDGGPDPAGGPDFGPPGPPGPPDPPAKASTELINLAELPPPIVETAYRWDLLNSAVDDCAKKGSQEARCGAEISALIAALTMSPAAGYATTSDCAANPDPKYELLHEPTP